MAGYILETSKSWSAVFNQTAAINITGWLVFLLLGTARPIIWGYYKMAFSTLKGGCYTSVDANDDTEAC